MAPLDKEEIAAQLQRLGISTPMEREACINEYLEYFTSYHETLADRFIRILKVKTRNIFNLFK